MPQYEGSIWPPSWTHCLCSVHSVQNNWAGTFSQTDRQASSYGTSPAWWPVHNAPWSPHLRPKKDQCQELGLLRQKSYRGLGDTQHGVCEQVWGLRPFIITLKTTLWNVTVIWICLQKVQMYRMTDRGKKICSRVWAGSRLKAFEHNQEWLLKIKTFFFFWKA